MKYFVGATEITSALESALDTPISVSFGVGTTTISVKSSKPLTKLYFDLTSSHDGTLSVQYYNGAFGLLTTVDDRTNSLKSRGWIKWTKPTDEVKNGDFYEYRFLVSGVGTLVVGSLVFAGVIFAEDKDCTKDVPNLADYIPEGDSSLIRFHVSAMDDLVQYFRGKGKKVYDTEAKQLTEYDFHDPSELKQAGKYLALAKLFFWRSDALDDKWYSKAKDFEKLAYDAADVHFLSLDTDGDGEEDSSEKLAVQMCVIQRG